jgi:2-hydroxychromene-2-carboxylate isomerase
MTLPLTTIGGSGCRAETIQQGAPSSVRAGIEFLSGSSTWEVRRVRPQCPMLHRSARRVGRRGRVEFDSEILALAAVAAKRLGCVEAYSHELFAALFADISVTCIDRAECIRLAARCSVTEAGFKSELESPATARDLSVTLESAYSLGVFGVPTFVVENVFWRNDRLILLRAYLSENR